MATYLVNKEQRPELFEKSRDEFRVAAVCDCGWASVSSDEQQAEKDADVHRRHFCPNRCG